MHPITVMDMLQWMRLDDRKHGKMAAFINGPAIKDNTNWATIPGIGNTYGGTLIHQNVTVSFFYMHKHTYECVFDDMCLSMCMCMGVCMCVYVCVFVTV